MISDILIPLLTIGLSELGDKTQLAIFCLSAKTNKKISLLVGVLLAFLITSFIASFFGGIIASFIPIIYLGIGSGIIFILFGFLIFFNKQEDRITCTIKRPLLSGFSLILISELGDKSQITTALFSTTMNPLFVFIGAFLSLSILSCLAVYFGGVLTKNLNKKKISIFSGIIFIALGIFTIIQTIFI